MQVRACRGKGLSPTKGHRSLGDLPLGGARTAGYLGADDDPVRPASPFYDGLISVPRSVSALQSAPTNRVSPTTDSSFRALGSLLIIVATGKEPGPAEP